jgi:hypothetical protein
MKQTSLAIRYKINRLRAITAHISPYLNGLAPETYDFVAALNAEASRLGTGIRYIATANRIEAVGEIERAAASKATLGGWFLRQGLAVGYADGEGTVLRRGNSEHRKKLRKRDKTPAGRAFNDEVKALMDRRLKLRHAIENADALLGRGGYIPGHWPKWWRHGFYMPIAQPHNARVRPKATLSQKDSGGNPRHLVGYLSRNAQDRPGILEMMVPKKGRGHF